LVKATQTLAIEGLDVRLTGAVQGSTRQQEATTTTTAPPAPGGRSFVLLLSSVVP